MEDACRHFGKHILGRTPTASCNDPMQMFGRLPCWILPGSSFHLRHDFHSCSCSSQFTCTDCKGYTCTALPIVNFTMFYDEKYLPNHPSQIWHYYSYNFFNEKGKSQLEVPIHEKQIEPSIILRWSPCFAVPWRLQKDLLSLAGRSVNAFWHTWEFPDISDL